ncbi:hypothetical protein PPN31114_03062 [Pandoraea pneumonica]|jgi:hypothetical protein|uniref:Uncharacterized protein n=1 Tax=Pandoraea pneumonica TaxID=2508299 RepID=A0A5E4W6H9_9BURK|nr:hypothetical protein [Pandoraea pneumonica]VVE19224.1 hypothetical protein PPN31114_03062 [Pandoraea pneumonica]
MARPSRELKDMAQIAALASLARRREASLRAAVAHAVQSLDAAEATLAQRRRVYEAQRQRWHDALARSGVYGQRALGTASHGVEAERAALAGALTTKEAAAASAAQARSNLQAQRALLQENARKQEKLRELLASLQAS